MKKFISLFFISAIVTQMGATSLYDQLCAFNFNWKSYPMQLEAFESSRPVTEQEYVQLHLSHVIPVLKSNDVADLNETQRAMRMHLIQVLEGYRDAGNFPLNEETNYRTPVFIDRYDTYCAVGYLMRASGFDDLAKAIAADNNLAWVKDIRVDGVSDWQQLSGLTLDELKLIQGAYDSYYPEAYLLPNKYEVPQKPEVVVRYFDDEHGRQPKDLSSATVWCKGEGQNGLLHGKWTQNYSSTFPWIEGYYAHGKRTGQWKEYYPGTNILCRTENWRDDKLNGIRKRFDREGKVVEEIMFQNGMAAVKTNYDFVDSVYHVRKPMDSAHVSTEVFTFGGRLLAAGNELVHNPGNLQWFQNIELTALNSFAITSREVSIEEQLFGSHHGRRFPGLFSPPLVNYYKVGTWKYYPEGNPSLATGKNGQLTDALSGGFVHYSKELNARIAQCVDIPALEALDSLIISYDLGKMMKFEAYGPKDYIHLKLSYYPAIGSMQWYGYGFYEDSYQTEAVLQSVARYNKENQRTGTWMYFTPDGVLARTETYMFPQPDSRPDQSSTVLPLGDAWKQ